MNFPQKIILFYQSSGQDETFDMQQPIFQNDFQISNPILYCGMVVVNDNHNLFGVEPITCMI